MSLDIALEVIAESFESRDKYLELNHQDLPTLPRPATPMPWVTRLDLSGNALETLPEWFAEVFPDLEWLDLAENPLSALPASFRQLTQLSTLFLRDAALDTAPEELADLPISMLDLSGNDIEALPDSMRRMHKLNSLDLSDNRVQRLPLWLAQLPSIGSVRASANPLLFPPLQIADRRDGGTAVVAFLREHAGEQ